MRRAFPLLLVLLVTTLSACSSGDPDVAQENSLVTVAYEGRLNSVTGPVFDSSRGVTLQLQGTIPGFRLGVTGMRVGETRNFVVPPELGYGDDPSSPVPPNSTLYFQVTLQGLR